MKVLLFIIAMVCAGYMGGYIAGHAQMQQAKPMIQQFPAQGYSPEVVVIKKDLNDLARVCVERWDSDVPDCRLVGDLRKWARERTRVTK